MRSEEEGLRVCHVSGELDAYTAPELRDALDAELAGDAGCATMVIDLSDLRYLDSTGLGILVGTAKRCRQAGGDLAVVCSRPNLLKIFQISGTQEILNVMSTVEAALGRVAELREARGCCGGDQGKGN